MGSSLCLLACEARLKGFAARGVFWVVGDGIYPGDLEGRGSWAFFPGRRINAFRMIKGARRRTGARVSARAKRLDVSKPDLGLRS